MGISVVGGRPRAQARQTPQSSAQARSNLNTADEEAVTIASLVTSAETQNSAASGAKVGVTDGAAASAQAGATPGSSGGDGNAAGELAAYVSRIRARIGENLRYPLALRRRGVQGRVGLRLTLDEAGALQAREISTGSGSAELDELALRAAAAAQPYPAPSERLRKKGPLILNLPVEFKLR